jgi:hypothetical protein
MQHQAGEQIDPVEDPAGQSGSFGRAQHRSQPGRLVYNLFAATAGSSFAEHLGSKLRHTRTRGIDGTRAFHLETHQRDRKAIVFHRQNGDPIGEPDRLRLRQFDRQIRV